MARTIRYAAITSSNTSSASGLLYRNIDAATGVTARAAPAINPAPGPLTRRTAAYSTPTDATPINACGSSMVNGVKPNSRPDSAMTQSAAGGLSTVIALPGSSDPNSHAVRFCVPACAAAA